MREVVGACYCIDRRDVDIAWRNACALARSSIKTLQVKMDTISVVRAKGMPGRVSCLVKILHDVALPLRARAHPDNDILCSRAFVDEAINYPNKQW